MPPPRRWCGLRACALAAGCLTLGAGAQSWQCQHCKKANNSFEDFLRPSPDLAAGEYPSDVHVLWATHVEVIPITTDNGGWEPPSFHQALAREAVRGWRAFQKEIVPSLPKKHRIRRQLDEKHAGALNDAFFHWQKSLFEESGDVAKSLQESEDTPPTPPPDANSSWPEMEGQPQYKKLRKIIDKLSRRYLIRSGMDPAAVRALNYSIFNWAAVHAPGEFHGPHTHVGEYHVGVFYAQAGNAAGKLRFGDPRGHSPPFGHAHFHTPRSGDLIFFPSWLSHMATVTAPKSDIRDDDGREPLRVTFSFNVGPVQGPMPCHLWWSDPTGDMGFRRQTAINPEKLGF